MFAFKKFDDADRPHSMIRNEIILKAAYSDMARHKQPAGRVFDTPGVDV
jgi:hypothetical protein